jgi:hypothetical protein
MKEQSQIDAMREAVRGDFERLRARQDAEAEGWQPPPDPEPSVVEEAAPEPEPEPEQVAIEEPAPEPEPVAVEAAPKPRRGLFFWRR